jgi:excisionase family DNA binding protein
MTPLLTPEEVCDILRVSQRFLYDQLSSGALPAHKVSNKWRIHPDDLTEYLRSRRNDAEPIADRWKLNLADPSEGE